MDFDWMLAGFDGILMGACQGWLGRLDRLAGLGGLGRAWCGGAW